MSEAPNVLIIADSDFRQRLDGGHHENYASYTSTTHVSNVIGCIVTGTPDPNHPELDPTEFTPGVPLLWSPRNTKPTSALSTDPYVVTSRPYRSDLVEPFLVNLPNIDAIVLLSFKAIRIAEAIAQHTGARILLRGHNIEATYYAAYAAAQKFPHKLGYLAEATRVRHIEHRIHTHNAIAVIADITDTDHRIRKQAAGTAAHHLPSFAFSHASAKTQPSKRTPQPEHVVFVGAFSNPTNVTGLRWFLRDVWPTVHDVHPKATLTLVGRDPDDEVLAWPTEHPNVELAINVPDVTQYLNTATVAINPVLTGSGINIKMADYLTSKTPVITTSYGARGLPQSVQKHQNIYDDAPSFAAEVCRHLNQTSGPNNPTNQAEAAAKATLAAFDLDQTEATLRDLITYVANQHLPGDR